MNIHYFVGLWFAAAPVEAEGPSSKDLEAILRVAASVTVQLHGRCGGDEAEPEGQKKAKAGGPVDLEAEHGFLRVAELLRIVVDRYPYTKLGNKSVKVKNDDIHVAVQRYEQAYRCNPGWEKRRYLDSALGMILARREQLSAEGLDLSEELRQDEARLREKLGELRPPVCEAKPKPCLEVKPRDGEPEPPRRGYRARLMDILSLRLELGGGFMAKVRGAGVEHESVPLVVSVAPGVRLLAGGRQRHVFGLGFRYTLLNYIGRSEVANMLTARFEYGIRAHEKWFSIHVGFEPGLATYPENETFGRTQIGGSGSLCTWNEALCLRFGGYATVGDRTLSHLDVGFGTFGVDIFRVIDNRLRGEGGRP